MSIENGYATLAELRNYLTRKRTYTAATISFAQTGSIIADTYKRLGRFLGAKLIQVSGSVAGNNGVWEVVSVSNSQIVVTGTLTTAAIGSSITLQDVTDTENDTEMERAIESASRAIDTHCHRRFFTTTEDEARVYSPAYPDCVWPYDDIVSIATLETDENGDGTYDRTWAATDYVLLPANAALDGKPYTRIKIAQSARYTFPKAVNSLKITGKFGRAAIPVKVAQACLIQAARFYERQNAIFGVIATTETMIATVKDDLDPDVQILLSDLVKVVV